MKVPVRHAGWFPVAMATTLTGMDSTILSTPDARDFPMHTSAYPVMSTPEPSRYNLKWGKLIARFHASIDSEFTDNLNLSDQNREADVSFGPNFETGFLWPMTRDNSLQLDLGVGYRWFANHPSVQSFNLAPNSRIDYRIRAENFQISLHDGFSIQADPASRPDIDASSTGNPINFRRFGNTAGIIAEWRPVREWSVFSGYNFMVDRSISGEFTSIDRNDQAFTAGSTYDLSARWTVGLKAAYTLTDYLQKVQNDATSYTLGPVFVFKASSFITVDAVAGYSVSTFDSSGTIQDSSEFRGFTGQLGIRHVLNSRASHELRVSQGRDLGLGSNFYDITALSYTIDARLQRRVTLHGKATYEHSRASIVGGETAERYIAYLGAGFQLSRDWSGSLGYTLSLKDSNLAGRDYTQNRMTFQLSRRF